MGMFIERRCPYCKVVISDSANKCPHCGEWLITEKEKEQLDKYIEKNKKFKQKAEEVLTVCVIIIFIILIFCAAISMVIDGIKNTFFSTSETNSTQETVLEEKNDIIDTDEKNYDYSMVERSLLREQPSESKSQSVKQPQKQIQEVPNKANVVMPQAKPVQAQQKQEINDFMY